MTNDHTFPGNFRRSAALTVKKASVVWCQYALLLLLLLLLLVLPVCMKNQTLQLKSNKSKSSEFVCMVVSIKITLFWNEMPCTLVPVSETTWPNIPEDCWNFLNS
jgi:hypothetical protein